MRAGADGRGCRLPAGHQSSASIDESVDHARIIVHLAPLSHLMLYIQKSKDEHLNDSEGRVSLQPFA